jgi:hypothetical protein
MKKLLKIKFIGTKLMVMAGFVFMLTSCENESGMGLLEDNQPASFKGGNNNTPMISYSNYDGVNSVTACGTALVADFYAGQNILVGTVTIENTSDSLYVTYQTTGNWKMGYTHLYVGDMSGLPTNNSGNPQIGHFPFSMMHNPMVNATTYAFDLDDFNNCFIVAAHAEVLLMGTNGDTLQTETGWADGDPINNGGSWATYANYCKQTCETSSCVYSTQYDSIFGGQTYYVGDLETTNDEDSLYVTFTTTGDWYLGHTHLYVGTLAGLPVNNSNAPVIGQFTYQTAHTPYVTSYTYAIALSSLPSCYIIAAHSEAHRVVNGSTVQSETAWSSGTQFPNTTRWGWYSSYCTQVCN